MDHLGGYSQLLSCYVWRLKNYTNEKRSLVIAQKICHYFIEETNAVLQKVSHMKDEEVALLNQLTLVETLWTEELKILQASAEILNSLQMPFRCMTQ